MSHAAKMFPNAYLIMIMAGTIKSPWRAVLVSPDLNGLVNSDLIANLNEPAAPELENADWIQPARGFWHWWSGKMGNWDSVAQIANGSKKAAAQLMTATEPYELSRSGSAVGTPKSEGVMAANDAKLQHSEWVREMLGLLLSSAE